MSESTTDSPPGGVDYEAVERSPEFQTLRRRFRGFVIPFTIAALVWFLGYVILATYASEFMATPVFGYVNIGLVLGLAQFVTTFGITMGYVAYANRRLDPLSNDLRLELTAQDAAAEGGQR